MTHDYGILVVAELSERPIAIRRAALVAKPTLKSHSAAVDDETVTAPPLLVMPTSPATSLATVTRAARAKWRAAGTAVMRVSNIVVVSHEDTTMNV